jgi:acetate kinase
MTTTPTTTTTTTTTTPSDSPSHGGGNGSDVMVLALNSGSSSLKASVISNNGETTIISFLAERLMTPASVIHVYNNQTKTKEDLTKKDGPQTTLTHGQALTYIIDYLREKNLLSNLLAVGHRVVHGGTLFSDSAIIEAKELEQIKSISHLAPL